MNLSLSKQPWYVQLAVFCALSLAAIVAFYFLYASPAQADADAKTQKLQQLRVEIDRGHVTERRLPQFEREAKTLEVKLDALKAVLPEEKDVGDLIFRMQQLAVQSNLKIKSFKPGAAISRQTYSELPSEIEFDGTYHNFGLFLDRLSKLSRIINVSDITIKARDKPEVSSTVTAKCTATTYVLIDPSKVPAAAPKAAR
jgi:type IV pilus assembly protein PilO